jgi:hypothetical protein
MNLKPRIILASIVLATSLVTIVPFTEAHVLSLQGAKRSAARDANKIARVRPGDTAAVRIDHCVRLSNHRVNCRAYYNFKGAGLCFTHTIRVRLAPAPSNNTSNTYTVPVKIDCKKAGF